ncbi:MAG: hypothetical protein AAGF25_06295 [Pseudomonadota bacterium]
MVKLKHRHLASALSAYEDENSSSSSELCSATYAPNVTLIALWLRHKSECRSISDILLDARTDNLPGVTAGILPDQFTITNKSAALAAMRKGPSK